MVPDPQLLRQSSDAINRLRILATQEIQASLRQQDRVYSVSLKEWLIVQPNLISSAAITLAMIRLRDNLTARAVTNASRRALEWATTHRTALFAHVSGTRFTPGPADEEQP